MVHPTDSAASMAAVHTAELHHIPAAASAAAPASYPFVAADPSLAAVAAVAFQIIAAAFLVGPVAAEDIPQTWYTEEVLFAVASILPYHHIGTAHYTLPNFQSEYFPSREHQVPGVYS